MISIFAEFEKARITERLVSGRIKKFYPGFLKSIEKI